MVNFIHIGKDCEVSKLMVNFIRLDRQIVGIFLMRISYPKNQTLNSSFRDSVDAVCLLPKDVHTLNI